MTRYIRALSALDGPRWPESTTVPQLAGASPGARCHASDREAL